MPATLKMNDLAAESFQGSRSVGVLDLNGRPTTETTGADRKPTGQTRLLPKEHGAYAILGVPLVTALIIAGLTPVTSLLTIATVAVFLAHEPLLILSGGRGVRARDAAPHAKRILVARLVIAIICGGLAFWLANPVAQGAMMVCGVFAVAEFAVSSAGHSRTLAAQILALAGLAMPSAVILTAGGIDATSATLFLLIWFAGRIATTVSVRLVIAQHKTSTSWKTLATCDGLLLAAGGVLVGGIAMGDRQWLASIPLLMTAVALRIRPPHPKYLKQIGWSLLAVNVVSGIAMVCLPE